MFYGTLWPFEFQLNKQSNAENSWQILYHWAYIWSKFWPIRHFYRALSLNQSTMIQEIEMTDRIKCVLIPPWQTCDVLSVSMPKNCSWGSKQSDNICFLTQFAQKNDIKKFSIHLPTNLISWQLITSEIFKIALISFGNCLSFKGYHSYFNNLNQGDLIISEVSKEMRLVNTCPLS
jgi:hypothetical protein